MRKHPLQLPLPCKGRGGWRPGAGRRRGDRVSHHGREEIPRPIAVHAVWHTRDDVPGLRGKALFRQVRESLRRCHEKEGFRIIHFSVQSNHVHLLAEADSEEALSRGMQGLGVSMAKRINLTSRRGPVFDDRYYARRLQTPREVAYAIDYVVRNEERHLERQGLAARGQPDPFSSAAAQATNLVSSPSTWLLRDG